MNGDCQKSEVRNQKPEIKTKNSDKKVLCSVFYVLFSVLCFLVVPAHADVSKGSADLPAQSPELKTQKADNSVITVAELSVDKHSTISQKTSETPETLTNQPNIDKTGEGHDTANSFNDNQDKNTNAPLGISYKSNETAIKAIEKNITLFKDKIKKRFSVWLERSAKYVEIMQDVLREKGMPEELVFLPIVESGFNLNAYSPARAVGPWQFIASTAKRYGLVIDWWRDERKDPVKSTHAAAEYLKDLYNMFGSWKLALAAYNAGEGKIMKALKRTGAEDYWSLLNTKQIRNETKEYVPRYIAASMIASTPEEYGFHDLAYHEPLEYDEVTLNSPVDIEVIAECAESAVEDIRELNPELRRWSTPPNVSNYTIRIPQGSKENFIENLNEIPVEERFSIDTYRVKNGDNLKKVAKKTGVPVNVILALNSMSGIESLDAGEEIKIPPRGKYYDDIDDKMSAKKVSYSKKISRKKSGKSNKKSAKKVSKTKGKVKTKKI
ncbi:MAG: transglycosylase SLT domain-containing protein [Nitrospirae bacterium]|nr:transglycosylase SLT domain-containing protein [Nitrospirota bacterium]MDA8213900.1 transglycosylase SLT domain-containing protein [Nitrospiraceae bacterium]